MRAFTLTARAPLLGSGLDMFMHALEYSRELVGVVPRQILPVGSGWGGLTLLFYPPIEFDDQRMIADVLAGVAALEQRAELDEIVSRLRGRLGLDYL